MSSNPPFTQKLSATEQRRRKDTLAGILSNEIRGSTAHRVLTMLQIRRTRSKAELHWMATSNDYQHKQQFHSCPRATLPSRSSGVERHNESKEPEGHMHAPKGNHNQHKNEASKSQFSWLITIPTIIAVTTTTTYAMRCGKGNLNI
jgi:hypothetical protein